MTCAVTNSLNSVLNSVGSQLRMDTCDVHAVLTFECVGKKFEGWSITSHKTSAKKIISSVLQSLFHNLHNKMRDFSTILLLETPGKDDSSWILTSEGAWFPSGLMTAIGLSGWPIKWLVARAATACWFIAFKVGWFALVTAIAKSPAVDGEPCALRYSLSCLFCFCWMK